MDRKMIDAYAAGGSGLADAIRGLAPAHFTAATKLGGWNIAQITLHLMDSDLIASDRMKRIIAEDNPAIIGFDESAFASNLFYEKQDPLLAAEIFRHNRLFTSIILKNLPESAFARFGTHNQRGRITLAQMVQDYADHLEHHLSFLRRKRQLLENRA